MGYGTIDTILDEIKTEVEEKVVGNSTYHTQPHIERGFHTWEDTDGRRPFIWFIAAADDVIESFNDRVLGNLTVELHGYSDTDGKSAEWMYKLLTDLKYFFVNDYTRKGMTNVGETLLYEGGIGDTTQMSGFVLIITIQYQTTTSVW